MICTVPESNCKTDLRANCANSSSSSSYSSSIERFPVETVVGIGELEPAMELESLASEDLGLESAGFEEAWTGRGEPEAIASCLASRV